MSAQLEPHSAERNIGAAALFLLHRNGAPIFKFSYRIQKTTQICSWLKEEPRAVSCQFLWFSGVFVDLKKNETIQEFGLLIAMKTTKPLNFRPPEPP